MTEEELRQVERMGLLEPVPTLLAEVRRLRDLLQFHVHQEAEYRSITWPVEGCVLCDELVKAFPARKEGLPHE